MARGSLIAVPLLLALLAASTLAQQPSRRVRVRARPLPQPVQPEAEERAEDPRVEYYAVQPQEEVGEPEAVVVVQPRARPVNNYYGNQLAPRADQDLRPVARPLGRAIGQQPRTKEHPREPPVQTIRNYNTINDDGSFTFGYEAADGSFKEETRGVDCVVRGKYGYIDPDGNKREFTYVSGNPCDPNNPDPEEDEREIEDSEENVPVRPAIRRPTPTPRPRPQQPAQPVFQNNYLHGERNVPRAQPVPITPRPVSALRVAEPATTYRPQIQNYPAVTTPRPALRTQQQAFYTSSPPLARVPTTASSIDFDAELKKFQIEAGAPVLRTTPTKSSIPAVQNVIQPQQFVTRPTAAPARTAPTLRPTAASPAGVNPYYSSQLIYDPSTGQYNTELYQNLPKGQGDFSLNHRLQSFVQPQQQYQTQFHGFPSYQSSAFAQPTPAAPTQYTPAAPAVQQQYQTPGTQQYQTPGTQQYQTIGAQQYQTAAPATSAAQFGPQQFSRAPVAENSPHQSFYYINPSLRNQYSTGQIDAFLRGHNIPF